MSVFLLFSLFALLLLSSCSSKQQLVIEDNGSGRGHLTLDLHPIFIQYLKDISAGFVEQNAAEGQSETEFTAFDIARINAALEQLEGVSLVSAITEGESKLDLAFVFADPEAVVPESGEADGTTASAEDGEGPPLVEFTRDGEERSLSIHLTSRNFSRLMPLVGIKERQNLMTFGPQPDPYSKEEYVEMMSYALGDYEDPKTIRRVLEHEKTVLRVEVPGTITYTKGFSPAENDSVAEAIIPFIRAATLNEPLDFEVRWKAAGS